jgi:hypothetical protein
MSFAILQIATERHGERRTDEDAHHLQGLVTLNPFEGAGMALKLFYARQVKMMLCDGEQD